MQRVSVDQNQMTRAEQRKQRLLEAETELAREEAEALKMTEEQRQMLLQPFVAVKAEFTDLDGLRWTQTALRKFQRQPQHRRAAQAAATSNATVANGTFVVLSHSDLVNSASKHATKIDCQLIDSNSTISRSESVKKTFFSVADLPYHHRDGTRSRSPIKGLFPYGPETDIPHFDTASKDDFADEEDDEVIDTDATVRLSVASKSRPTLCAPPGLSPAPSYHGIVKPAFPLGAGVSRTASTMQFHSELTAAVSQRPQSQNFTPLPHRDAPSPPSMQKMLAAPSSSLSSAMPPCYSMKTARKRLHSLLHDVRRPSAPPSPIPRPACTATVPSPLQLSSIFTETASRPPRTTTQENYHDDDETPRPSPTLMGYDSPSIPWIQTFN